MEFVIVGCIALIAILVLKFMFQIHKKEWKQLTEDEERDALAKNYPGNIEMCQEYLKKLNKEDVKIEENKGAQASLYIAITNKILIADIQKSYTRIQTIAHECLHSAQSRKLLLGNFIFSNVYLLYFIIICALLIFKVLPYKMMFLAIFLILSMVYCTVRVFLENDAMIKARYLAKEYMEEKNISSKQEIEKLISGFDKINQVGVQYMNYSFFLDSMMKLFILATLALIF